MITVKIVGQLKIEENIPEFMMVERSKGDTVADIISKMQEKYKIPRKKYSENLKKSASPFTGLLVSKNEEVVGMFEADGYEPRPDMDQSVKDGDRIFFVLPAAGG
jgi:molybdopterin converting factor small subunit